MDVTLVVFVIGGFGQKYQFFSDQDDHRSLGRSAITRVKMHINSGWENPHLRRRELEINF